MRSKEFMSVNEISEFMNQKPSWIRLQILKKTIPFYKIQGRVMFKVSEIESWLVSKKINPSIDGHK